MIRPALAALLLLASPCFASGDDDHAHEDHDDHEEHAEHADHDDHDDHLAEAEGVRILHAWTTATSGDTARVYLEIENTGKADLVLAGGDTEIGASVALVGLNYTSSGAEPQPLGEFPVPAGTELALTPDGLFLLVEGLEKPLGEDEDFDMHVELEPVGEIEIHVDVEPEGTRQHPHAGHNH